MRHRLSIILVTAILATASLGHSRALSHATPQADRPSDTRTAPVEPEALSLKSGTMGVRPANSVYIMPWTATELLILGVLPAVALGIVGLCSLGRTPTSRACGDVVLAAVAALVMLPLVREPVEDVANPVNLMGPAFDARCAVFAAFGIVLGGLALAVVAARAAEAIERTAPPAVASCKRHLLLSAIYTSAGLLVAEAVVGYAGSAWLLTTSAWWPLIATVAILAAALSLRVPALAGALPLAPVRRENAPAQTP